MLSPKKTRPLVAAILALASLVLVLGGAMAVLALLSAPARIAAQGGRLFTVERGEGAQSIANRLEKDGLIRSAFAFRILGRIKGTSSGLKAGTYRIEPDMGTAAILDLLGSGKQALVRVTIPEGYTLNQSARLLERSGISKAEEFLAACRDPELIKGLGLEASSLEGYLFPDTYYLPLSMGGPESARMMVKNFRQKIAGIAEASAFSPPELQERVILASIIEREYKLDSEAPLISSVFLNRLRIRMALQSCATVVYVITERLGKPHPEVIYDRDLKIADPFNTYLKPGLPPGPISNPGLTALTAAFRPEKSSFLYFRLVDAEKGKHHFSQTLEEHLDARKLFIKRVGG
jgi:UPF0755 protein